MKKRVFDFKGHLKSELKPFTKGWRPVVLVTIFTVLLVMRSIAGWYQFTHRNEPVTWGVSFSAPYARKLGVDPKQTLTAMVDDLGFRRLRLMSYWNEHEKQPGKYDFSELDWQMQLAESREAKVILSLGLRQPRYPECFMPDWATKLPKEEWYKRLSDYMRVVVERYKNSPALQAYQVENEYFLEVFGKCPDFNKQRLIDEFALVRSLDPNHPIYITRSNNAVPSWPVGEPRGDMVGAAVYKRVWDRTITKRYFEYPIPAWFYGFLAGGTKLTTGRESYIHELQAEPWLPDGFEINQGTLAEQDKSMNADRLKERLEYAQETGIKTIDLWGAEWWYWRMTAANDPSLWQTAKQSIR